MPDDHPPHPIEDGERSAGAEADPIPVPDFVDSRDQVVRDLVGFVRILRAAGATVPANAAREAGAALSVVGLDDRAKVETALEATLVADPRDGAVFADQFPEFWRQLRASIEGATTPETPLVDEETTDDWGVVRTSDPAPTAEARESEGPGPDEEPGEGTPVLSGVDATNEFESDGAIETMQRPFTYSAVGRRERPSNDGRGSVTPLNESDIRAFERAVSTLPGRRVRWSAGPSIDRRRTLRRSLSTGGVPVVLPTRMRAETEFSPTVLVDVSRSVLDTIDRTFLLAFLARLHRDGRSSRTFFFDTDLQDVTDVFERAGEDPARALEAAAVEWGGGTRIGNAIQTVRSDHTDAVDRRRIVIVISDGLDVGEQDGLKAGMTWLARQSRAVLWLNPLATSPAYEPTAQGMATALPYVDGLFAFSESRDLTEIAHQIRQRGLGGSLGYQYGSRNRGEHAR